jgi:hypothetical protein
MTAAFHAARKVLADNAAGTSACYNPALAHRPDLAGRVVVDLALASGRQPTVLLHASTLNLAKVDNCIVQFLKTLTYPKVASGEPAVLVRYVFAFPLPGANNRR